MTPQQMRDRYERGWTLMELAEEEGCAHSTVRNRLLAVGAVMRPSGGRAGVTGFVRVNNRTRQHREEILRARAAGDTLQAIGDRYGVTRERIRQVLKEWAT